MRIRPHHDSEERIVIARLCGITEHFATKRPFTDEVVARAVARLHEVTRDPDLLGHAWPPDSQPPGWPQFPRPHLAEKRTILSAAGAKPQLPWWEDRAI